MNRRPRREQRAEASGACPTIADADLRDPLPKIPIPLLSGDPDLTLDLQPLFTNRYARSRYEQTLNYSVALEPPLKAEDAEWMAGLLRAAGRI